MSRVLSKKIKSSKGQTLIEYGLIIFMCSIVIFGAFQFFGPWFNNIFGKVTSTLTTAGS